MFSIRQFTETDKNAWDTYVHNHPQATLYHLSGWKNVIEKTYGHKTYYLLAAETEINVEKAQLPSFPASQHQAGIVVGILPLVHIKHFFFGNSLISLPFLDYGGILADGRETEKALIEEAIKIGRKLGAGNIELRNIEPLELLNSESYAESKLALEIRSHKVRMILELPGSSDELMKSFKSKLRSQIRKPLREGLTATVGGVDLLGDFYRVFAQNMRDLGSPVHSKCLIQSVFDIYPKETRIVVIYQDRRPLACSFVAGFKKILENPWASSLKEHSKLAPNMLLYWTMLEYACDAGFKSFDFGRSTPNEGTFKFKSQWGAEPIPLNWHYIYLNGNPGKNTGIEKSKFDRAIRYWQKLPVPVTKILGPRIRKYIGL